MQFTEEECAFIKTMTEKNYRKLQITKNDLVKANEDSGKSMNISGALTYTDFVSASMQWLMADPNVIFGNVEDKNAYIVITLLRDMEEQMNGEQTELKMSILEKVADRLQQEPRLKPHLPF